MKPIQSETKEKSSKKKKSEKAEIEKSVPVEVSKDIYYTISETLTESLKNNEKFSLLKTCRREKNDTDVDDRDAENNDINHADISRKNDKDEQFKFHFSAKNTSKYESDNENINETFDMDIQVVEQSEDNNCINGLFGYKDTLFLKDDDVRFNEAVRFFNIEAVSNDEFKNLRRELKVIVRTKIRRNERKYQSWNKKRKLKRS
ncbi:hypothetical protein EAI_09655 [Harpegnathos saltator]|nr:hypothetical protein EAI_09655 [Harpegnathos saltator]